MTRRTGHERGRALRGAATLGAALLVCVAPLPAGTAQAATKTPHAPKPPQPPTAVTGDAKSISETTAALEGTVNPKGSEASYYFQYGTTTAYGAQTPTTAVGAGTTGVKVSQPLKGLAIGTSYHFRVVATSAAGTSDGPDRTFMTKQIPLRFVLPGGSIEASYRKPFTLAGTLSGTGAANHPIGLQANPFPYLGIFETIGGPSTTSAQGGFSLRVAGLTQNTRLRVQTLEAPPVFSQSVTVRVAVLVTLRVQHTRTPGLVRLYGTVTPGEAGAPVLLQRVRATGGPVNAGKTTARGASASLSRFSALVKIRRTGEYRALVKVTNGKQVSGESNARSLRAPPKPPRHRHGRR
ncbi:MAG TPA: hypothetical protein VK756_08135 [Solirubrobacteraceae bacterium]|jgi:hypothetical protein|nr:hypothetical protein [Solirubrobacteraceae bacterium]